MKRLGKIHFYGLVKQAVLQVGVVCLLFITVQAKEQAGGIALINGYFEVAGRVKQGQFFALGYVGIGFADAFDMLVAAKFDVKAASAALGLTCSWWACSS